MDMSEAQAWAIIIGTMFAGIVSAIGVIKTGKVHTLVNSAMTAEKAENALLKAMLTAKTLEMETAERTRADLARATAATPSVTLGTTPVVTLGAAIALPDAVTAPAPVLPKIEG